MSFLLKELVSRLALEPQGQSEVICSTIFAAITLES